MEITRLLREADNGKHENWQSRQHFFAVALSQKSGRELASIQNDIGNSKPGWRLAYLEALIKGNANRTATTEF